MGTWAYYGDSDPFAAQWLRNLIKAKLISDGEVDERPIQEVKPYELRPFTRCHFFAGIAGWDLALSRANFPTDRQVWTGSCPCQPFSTAGKRLQFDDERHLWPYWFHLISVCCPPIIFGEQVANGAGLWLDLVFADLESQDYAIGAAVLPAAGVGAPHIRNRVWFVANADASRRPNASRLSTSAARADIRASTRLESGDVVTNAHSESEHVGALDGEVAEVSEFTTDAECVELRQQSGWSRGPDGPGTLFAREPGPTGWWEVEPEVGRVADGIPRAMEQLRAYGNAIVPQVASEFVKAYLACQP